MFDSVLACSVFSAARKEKQRWRVSVPLTCSSLTCSVVEKTSGYEGRSKTRSNASSCCCVKASALRCFRKLSTLPWESLFGPEPSEPSTRRKSNIRDTDPGKLAFTSSYALYILLMFFSCTFSVGDLRNGVQVFLYLNGCGEPLATLHRLFPAPLHSINTIMIWKPSGNWWITVTCKYIHIVASMCTNESSSKPIIVPFHFSQCIFLPSFLPPHPKPYRCYRNQEQPFFLKHNFPFTIQYCFHSQWAGGSIWKQQQRTRGWIKLYILVQSSCSPNTGIFSRLLTWLLVCWEKDASPVVTCVQRFQTFTDHPSIAPSLFLFSSPS